MIFVWVFAMVLVLFGMAALFGAPYVPSLKKEVRFAFDELYPVHKGDVVVDLGSGDGVVLSEAVRRGASAYGYEINPFLVLLSKLRLRDRATIRLADMWSVRIPKETTLVYIFSVSRDTKKLGQYLQKQADTNDRAFQVVTFGARLPEHTTLRELRGHCLYVFEPLRR